MDNLRRGEQIAGASGVALLLIMFIFDWFSVSAPGGGISVGGNAWDTMEIIRFILLLTALAGVGLAIAAITQSDVNMPVAASAIATGLGILSVILVAFRIISPPDGGLGDLIDVGRSIGVFLGLIASAGVAYGGWVAMQEEGTSFGARRTDSAATRRPPPPPSSPEERDASGRFERPLRVQASAIAFATRPAIATMVIIGLTPIEVGNRLASATWSRS